MTEFKIPSDGAVLVPKKWPLVFATNEQRKRAFKYEWAFRHMKLYVTVFDDDERRTNYMKHAAKRVEARAYMIKWKLENRE